MNSNWRIPLFAVLALCSTLGSLRAEDQTATYRLIGLCSPDRQEDLRRLMNNSSEVKMVSFDYEKAQITLRYDLTALIPAVGKKTSDRSEANVIKRLNELIGKQTRQTFSVTALSTLTPDQLTHLDIKIGILDCKGCRYAAYLAVAKMDGVERVIVNSEARIISAWIDPTKTNLAALQAALKKDQVPLTDP